MSLDVIPWEARLPLVALDHAGNREYVLLSETNDHDTNCSILFLATLEALYGKRVRAEISALMCWAGEPESAPIDAVVRLGIGGKVDKPIPGCWHACHGITHSFFWYEPPAPFFHGAGIQVQANKGPGSFVETDQTWLEQIARYEKVYLAALVQS